MGTTQRVMIGIAIVVTSFLLLPRFSNHGPDFNFPLHGPPYFAVVINTYKRPDMLRGAVQHYANTCGKDYGVASIFVVWAEVGKDPPTPDDLLADSSSLRKSKVGKTKNIHPKITILPVEKDSLNSRFLPIQELSEESVFVVDDDVRVDCPSLLAGFKAWQMEPSSMVGYYPRLASPPLFAKSADGKMVYHTWPLVYLRNKFNMILTKACFLHRRYLDLYSSGTHPQEIKDYVDVHKNCEDVAMALLVANVTKTDKSFPVYVQGSVSDLGLFNGISTGVGHFGTRSECLTDLTKIYAKNGWDYPLVDVPLSTRSRFLGFLSRAKPSNFFEWLALGNTLT